MTRSQKRAWLWWMLDSVTVLVYTALIAAIVLVVTHLANAAEFTGRIGQTTLGVGIGDV